MLRVVDVVIDGVGVDRNICAGGGGRVDATVEVRSPGLSSLCIARFDVLPCTSFEFKRDMLLDLATVHYSS